MAQVFTPELDAHGTWLVPAEAQVLTPFRYRARKQRPWLLELAVVHFTATPWAAAHRARFGSNEARQRDWLMGLGRKSSTHFDTLRDGLLLQAAPLEDRTWHAGGSRWTAPDGRIVADVNHRAIGLDLDNVGRIFEAPGGDPVDSYEWAAMHTAKGETQPNYKRGPLRAVRALFQGPSWRDDRGRLWEAYTGAQLRAFLKLVRCLVQVRPVLRDPRRWVGHEEIRSTKSDPGPAFPWSFLQAALQPTFTDALADEIDWSVVPGVIP